jgi:peroxiredoxin Q/BCP
MTTNAAGLHVGVGDQLPSVGLRASDGYLLNLRSFVGKQPAVLVFFGGPTLDGAARDAGDALVDGLKRGYERLTQAGIALVGITCDNEEQQKQYIERHELPFLLFSDERRSAVELLGVPTTADGDNYNAQPTAVAVSRDGTIVDVVENAAPKGLIVRLLESIEESHPAQS